MPKKRDYSKSSVGREMLARVRCIHEILQPAVPQYDEKTGMEKLPNATDIQRHLMTDEGVGKKYSLNTIRRDIKFMIKDWKLPIRYDKKRHGFRYTKHVDKLPLVTANEGDLFGLLVFVDSLKQYEGTPLHAQLSTTMDKLMAQLQDDATFPLGDLGAAFSHRQKHPAIFNPKVLEKVSKAVSQCLTLKIKYKKPQGKRAYPRTIDPYHVTNVDGKWMVISYDHDRKEMRWFAVSRIEGEPQYVRERAGVNKTFERPKGFRVEQFMDFGLRRGDKLIDVTLRFSPEVATWIKERKWHHSQRWQPRQNGGVEFSLQLTDTTEFRSWILSWGQHVKVIKPKELRDEVREIGKRIAENNA